MKIKISQLPLADAITGAEAVPIGQGGATVQTTTGDLIAQGTSNKSTSTLPFAMYGNNYMGKNEFGTSQNKFVALAASAVPTNYLTFQFIGGVVNGVNIPLDNPLVGSSITLTPSTVTFTNTPRGLVPNQYTTFINSIMEGLNLVSRIETTEYAVIPSDPDNANGGGGRPYWNQMNYCDADTFFLLFQETGTIPGGSDMAIPYGFKSYNGLGGFNLYGYSVENLNNFQTMQSFLQQMNAGNSQNSFIQQLP